MLPRRLSLCRVAARCCLGRDARASGEPVQNNAAAITRLRRRTRVFFSAVRVKLTSASVSGHNSEPQRLRWYRRAPHNTCVCLQYSGVLRPRPRSCVLRHSSRASGAWTLRVASEERAGASKRAAANGYSGVFEGAVSR